jgi:succinyl-CoA synthetase beta subunit
MIEINPLVLDDKKRLICLDCKMGFDENALYRHPDIAALRDKTEENSLELEAAEHDLSYIALDGNIGCMVNGAGLAMTTMDLIKLHGAAPANFLDVGGSASEERVRKALEIILSDTKIRSVLINIFGGIMKCDLVAKGLVNAVNTLGVSIPLVIRLEGTNAEEGLAIIKKSGLNVSIAQSLSEAAETAVNIAKKSA